MEETITLLTPKGSAPMILVERPVLLAPPMATIPSSRFLPWRSRTILAPPFAITSVAHLVSDEPLISLTGTPAAVETSLEPISTLTALSRPMDVSMHTASKPSSATRSRRNVSASDLLSKDPIIRIRLAMKFTPSRNESFHLTLSSIVVRAGRVSRQTRVVTLYRFSANGYSVPRIGQSRNASFLSPLDQHGSAAIG